MKSSIYHHRDNALHPEVHHSLVKFQETVRIVLRQTVHLVSVNNPNPNFNAPRGLTSKSQ